VRGNFSDFFNGICEAVKVRDLGRALPASCGKFQDKKIRKSEKSRKNGRKSENLKFLEKN
jgi:hypothetical protein